MRTIQTAWAVLSRLAPLRVIKNEDDYATLRRVADLLADEVGDDTTHPLFSMFEVALVLIESWESKNVSIPDAPPREVLRFLLKDHRLRQKDLADITSPSNVSDILAGRRPISRKVAVKLAKRFNVSVSAFI